MVDFLQNEDESLDSTASDFKCDQLKRKGNMESTVWKCSGKYSLYYRKRIKKIQYEFPDARIHLYVPALLGFDIVKTAYVLFPSSWFYKRYSFLSLIHVTLIKDSLEQSHV